MPITQEEVNLRLSDPKFTDIHERVFEWIGDYPDPDCYLPEPLSYIQGDDGSLIVTILTQEEYRKFIDNSIVLPALTSSEKYVGVYRKKKLV